MMRRNGIAGERDTPRDRAASELKKRARNR